MGPRAGLEDMKIRIFLRFHRIEPRFVDGPTGRLVSMLIRLVNSSGGHENSLLL
jgi:hypothetical protein